MPGRKLDAVQVEDLIITNDGRGLKFYNDGSVVLKSNVWDGPYYQSGSREGNATARRVKFLCAASSSGWLRLTVVSGTADDSTYYIPVFNNVNTKSST